MPLIDINTRLARLIALKQGEGVALFWAFSYFFALLCSYYIIRPMRDEMGIIGGVENLQWLFTGTFIAMLAAVPLYGWLTTRYTLNQFLILVYVFFIACLLAFYVLFLKLDEPVLIARGFFIWVSVFNLFVVSVFWSFMADVFNNAEAKRLFAVIAAGGTSGAIAGPAITASLVVPLGKNNLLLVSALSLVWAVIAIHFLIKWKENKHKGKNQPLEKHPVEKQKLSGGIFAGVGMVLQSRYLLGIAIFMLLFTTLSTFLYFQQAEIIKNSFSNSDERTAMFASIDLIVNVLTVSLQLLVTSRIIKGIGLGWTLALLPALLCLGFIALAIAPGLLVIVVVQVIRRAGNYAITRPARELLYVVLSREEKYKAKNVNDTVVYRGGDAVSAWFYAGLKAFGLSLSQLALVAVPLAVAWAWLAYRLGIHQGKLAQKQEP